MDYSISIDKISQDFWKKNKINTFNIDDDKKKLYVLEMFSYPSGSNLHAGHWFNFGLVDSYARYKKMNGFNVFQPMGFDAFGLPAENYAIKTGIHPKESTMKNIDTMRNQLDNMGAMFNFENEIITCTPDYYKWTQWLFLKLYENDLAYRKNAPVNFCPSCNTVLANEQVIENKCERCSSEIEKKNLTQWFFKITKYADELVDKLNSLDWPEKTKSMQKNWIGRSYGTIVNFSVENSNKTFDVFTTRVDTLMGVSYVVLAPEHPLVLEITTNDYLSNVKNYIDLSSKQSEIDRVSSNREKTGEFTGAYAIHPITNKKLPIWISDYVISTYGTGAVMAVPAHDERDFEFSKKFNLPIFEVIKTETQTNLPITEKGTLINSEIF
ncbi:MAG TPA: class I tRNA ligase family protein, partial [Candidatus Dwaynia gallinarum]|nr:class I tRNA ligase family protein [Candidatus Dwaynia gallinarum]